MKLLDCTVNSPSFVSDVTAAWAPANLSSLGRITAQCGKFALMNSQGTGKIRLGCTKLAGFSGGLLKKSGNVSPEMGSLNGATGCCTLLPAKSTHSRKLATSSPPIPKTIFNTSTLLTFWPSAEYRL